MDGRGRTRENERVGVGGGGGGKTDRYRETRAGGGRKDERE